MKNTNCNELLKYDGANCKSQLTELIGKIIKYYLISDESLLRKTIMLFKKGNKNISENSRAIILLSTVFKLTTNIITNEINILLSWEDEH